jgi:hypothetical protein
MTNNTPETIRINVVLSIEIPLSDEVPIDALSVVTEL